ncbi:MAG: MarR family transcriptional regulator [Polyangia bacterium]
MSTRAQEAPDPQRELEARTARLRVADVVGNLMEFWGFKRGMGRVWALCYTSPKALSAADIGAELQMSAGAVSMTLAELTKWGVVRRSWVPGDRRDFYEAETSVWKLVSRVVRERELTLVREAKESFVAADRALQLAAQGGTPEEKKRRAFERDRIGQLRSIAETGESLLSALVAGEAISAAPLAVLGAATALYEDVTRRRRR